MVTFPREDPDNPVSDAEYERQWKKALDEAYDKRLTAPTFIADEIFQQPSPPPRVTRKASRKK